MIRLPPRSTRTDTLFPYTTLFRSSSIGQSGAPACSTHLRAVLTVCPSTRRSPYASAKVVLRQRQRPDYCSSRADLCYMYALATVAASAREQRLFLPRLPHNEPTMLLPLSDNKSENRRVGKQCLRTCRASWSQ